MAISIPPLERSEMPDGQRAATALDRAAYYLDRALVAAPKARAYHRAAGVAREHGDDELEELLAEGRLQELAGIGPSTSKVIVEALGEGPLPELARIEEATRIPTSSPARPYLEALRGDCHLHSDWSDGGAPIEAMARHAMAIGHEYMVLTDHSARLTVAHGLDRDRLVAQLEEISALDDALGPSFRLLAGMEVDILEDGSLDLDEDLLERLDVVVASAHSKLRMDRKAMTQRLVLAAANPHVDILGHCTGRKLKPVRARRADTSAPIEGCSADGHDSPEVVRPQSTFDAEVVFAACSQFGTAVEVNCRPERQDPPDELLSLALEWGCTLSVDTDAHAPGQLEWQPYGCEKLARFEVDPRRVINTLAPDELVAWTRA